jgi:signal transduction histidine kinase
MERFFAFFDRYNLPKRKLTRAWGAFFGQARTRILLWYVILMVFFLSACIPIVQQFVIANVKARVQADLEEEIEIFHQRLAQQSPIAEQLPPKPFLTAKELRFVFREHLKRQIPEDDTYLITFVEGQFFKTSSAALPTRLHPKQDLMERWSILEEPEQGEIQVGGSLQSILYMVEPIHCHGKHLGVLVVAHTTGGEREEAFETLVIVIQVMIGVMLVTLLLTWWGAGRVLTPLRRLAETAQAIGESDLTQRLSVQGDGEISQLARIFNEMMDRLQTAFSSQREFVNDAGHELKTPITIIQGHLELMGDDPIERQETLMLVMDELARMNRLVNELLLLAKAERPDFLVLETIDVRTLTEELYAKVTTLADRHWQLEAVGRGFAVLDRQRITEAILNLVQNATQYTQVDDTISLGSSVGGKHVYFWVRDTGEGIALSHQQRIFERFARASGNRRRSEGSGLGLSIVQAIVEAHSGRVTLQSQLGVGSTFTIILPIDR